MNPDRLKAIATGIIKQWGCSILLLPFVIYSLHQAYGALRFNIFFSISYDFPFPINIIHLFLDNFLLIIHEAGHMFLGIFGWRTLTILGGSLWEVMLPVIILAYFWVNNSKTGIQLSLYLVGFSILQVAYYVADASARQLPLLGGLPKEAHDWSNLLIRWNALEYDTAVAICLAIIAVLIYLAALAFPFYHQSYKTVDLDLNL